MTNVMSTAVVEQ